MMHMSDNLTAKLLLILMAFAPKSFPWNKSSISSSGGQFLRGELRLSDELLMEI